MGRCHGLRHQPNADSPGMRIVVWATLLAVLLVAVPAGASAVSREHTRAAFNFAYNLQFAECYERLSQAVDADPDDPAPPRAIAAVTWIEIIFSQGIATYEAFSGQISKSDVTRPPAPPQLRQRFLASIDRALTLAERRAAQIADADAYYQVGASAALWAVYQATVEGRLFGAIGDGRRAVKAMERARALDPHFREAALVLGMYRYTVSTLSAPVRLLAGVLGLSGDRAKGLALLEEAASPGAETEADALWLLLIADNREHRPRDAATRLTRLRSQLGSNRLLTLNAAATALEDGQFEVADRLLFGGEPDDDSNPTPHITGEHALWLLKRGTTRAALGRTDDARTDLTRGLASGPRDWVRARLHVELGKLALAASAPAEARVQFEQAIALGERSGDEVAVRDAKTRLRQVRVRP